MFYQKDTIFGDLNNSDFWLHFMVRAKIIN